MSNAPKYRLRLVEVTVQPIVMIDDGTTLRPVEHPPVAIPAEEWETYSSERFPRELAAWEARINAEAAEAERAREAEEAENAGLKKPTRPVAKKAAAKRTAAKR